MRRGKEIAQGSHASMSFLTKQLRGNKSNKPSIKISDDAIKWMTAGFTKVCLKVNSEKELLEKYQAALKAKLEAHLITDAGHTEFGGEPTNTAVAIGPNKSSEIDKITGDLPLY